MAARIIGGVSTIRLDTISDVVVHARYTAIDGGDKLKKSASDSVLAYIKSVEGLSREESLFAAFDLKHDFPTEWHKAMSPAADNAERVLMLNNLNERLPVFTKGKTPKERQATDLSLFSSTNLSASPGLIQCDEIKIKALHNWSMS